MKPVILVSPENGTKLSDTPIAVRDFVIDEWGVAVFGTVQIGDVSVTGAPPVPATFTNRLRRAWAALYRGRM